MDGTWKKLFVVILLSNACAEETHCLKNQKCIPYSQCHIRDTNTLLYPCHSGLNLVCCPSGSYNSTTNVESRKTALFPVKCGIITSSDKISGGDKADLGQFPWMALLGYRQKQVDYTQFLCGGSIVTEYYILTAAHCTSLDRRLELVTVRLGELDLSTEIDCYKIDDTKICADRYVDKFVEHMISHPNFKENNLKHDIALIKLKEKIKFTDFIKPICLPFERNLEKRDLAKQNFTVSGWGKTKSANLGGSTALQYALVRVWDQNKCSRSVPPEVQPIENSQLCANGVKTEDACKGDSGGPLINATIDRESGLRYVQVGVVSFASTLTCGNSESPTVYTRVDKYLKWIVDNVA